MLFNLELKIHTRESEHHSSLLPIGLCPWIDRVEVLRLTFEKAPKSLLQCRPVLTINTNFKHLQEQT